MEDAYKLYVMVAIQVVLVAFYMHNRRKTYPTYIPMFISFSLLALVTAVEYQLYIYSHDRNYLYFFTLLTILLLFPADISIVFWTRALPNLGTDREPPYAKRFNRFAYRFETDTPVELKKFSWIYDIETEGRSEEEVLEEIKRRVRRGVEVRRVILMLLQLMWFSFVAMMYTMYDPILLGYWKLPSLFKSPEDILFIYFIVVVIFPVLPFLLEMLYALNPTAKGNSFYKGARKTFFKYSRYNSFWATVFFILAIYLKIVNISAIKIYISTLISYILWITLFFTVIQRKGVVSALLNYAFKRVR
ncbi:MAG: hypothetical protein J7L88_02775 [Thermoplasmata archaeon]|nr:hypothetical protein [Thermoplasmata archaeon]